MRKLFLIATLALLAACNTLEGVGRDVKSAGESLERVSKR